MFVSLTKGVHNEWAQVEQILQILCYICLSVQIESNYMLHSSLQPALLLVHLCTGKAQRWSAFLESCRPEAKNRDGALMTNFKWQWIGFGWNIRKSWQAWIACHKCVSSGTPGAKWMWFLATSASSGWPVRNLFSTLCPLKMSEMIGYWILNIVCFLVILWNFMWKFTRLKSEILTLDKPCLLINGQCTK